MMMVLRIYLEKGIQESFISTNRSEKFSSVGLRTNILGGNWYSSSRGFNALLIIITNGSTMKIPQMNIRTNKRVLPAMDRFSCFSLLRKKRLFLLIISFSATYSPTLPNIFCTSLLVPTINRNRMVAIADAYPMSKRVEP